MRKQAAVKKVVLENEYLSVTILPELGGKVSSFWYKPAAFELAAQNPCEEYYLPEEDAAFEEYDASGLDDAFPNIDKAQVERNGKFLVYPDHGEIWSHAFQVQSADEKEAVLSFDSSRVGYHYEKTLRLADNRLEFRYRITNIGEEALPCIWTFHGLMRYEEDMRLVLPSDLTSFRNVMDSDVLGADGLIYPKENKVWDFEKVPPRTPETSLKFYGNGKSLAGRCGLEYPTQGVRCEMTYDAEKLPWFGVWITAGGFRGDYNLAMEPTNGYYDDILKAGENGCLYELAAGAVLEFGLAVSLDKY